MSSEIFYDKAFILVGDKYIPVVNHGSSNCFDFDRRGREIPEKYWSVLNYPHTGRVLFTAEEVQEIADAHEESNRNNRGGTRKSRNRSFEEGEFGRWILAGMKSAHTVEDYKKHGNTVAVVDYSHEHWQRNCVSTTEELLDKLEELSGHRVTVAFLDDRHVTHPPMRRKGKPTDYSALTEYYVLQSVYGYFSKRSCRRIWFVRCQPPCSSMVRKFKKENDAQKYLEDNRDIFEKYAFQVECVQNGGAVS